jgi:hypothetical protein
LSAISASKRINRCAQYASAGVFPQAEKPQYKCDAYGTAEQLAEKVVSERKPRPQRLKPYSK